MSDQPLSIHPEVRRLTDENDLLREELTALLSDVHELVDIVKPNLLAIYQKKIGVWELQLLQAQCEAKRAKRRLELAQASLNHGTPPDWNAIDGQIELEFLQWQTRIAEAVEKLKAAETRLQNLLPPEQDRELKKLYYALVKLLHPDVNPDLSDDQRRLWLRVQDAYDARDMQELKALLLLAEKGANVPPPPASLDVLRKEQETLSKQITATLERIEHIESQPPFTLRNDLENEAWVASRRDELEKQTAEWQKQRDALSAHLQTLTKGTGDGKIFGNN